VDYFVKVSSSTFSPQSAAYLAQAQKETEPLLSQESISAIKNFSGATASVINHVTTFAGLIVGAKTQREAIIEGSTTKEYLALIETLLPFSNLTDAQKRALEHAQFLHSIIDFCVHREPLGFLIDANIYIYGTLLAPQLEQLAVDPPDSDYQSVVIPDAVQVPVFPSTGDATLDAALRKSHLDALLAQSFLKAVNVSYDRYSSAYAAGDGISAGLQVEAVLYFLSRYDKAIRDSAADLNTLVRLSAAAGFTDSDFDAAALSNLQANIASNGLPPQVTELLTGLGFTTSQLEAAKTRLLAVNPQTISGTIFGSVADMAVAARWVSSQPPSATDINRDGKPDFVLFKPSTRQTALWYMNNNAYLRGAYGRTLPAGWIMVDAADFNRDGKPDYVLFKPSMRQTAIWYLSGPAYVNGAYGPTLPSGWELSATGDFNGDGKPDYVLYNASTRQTALWYLNNNVRIDAVYGPSLPASWRVVAVADFNGDGKPDYLLFNATTRQSAIWYLSGVTRIGAVYGPTIASGYQLIGAADFNGDGRPDYVLFNASTRQTAIWYLNNNVRISAAFGPTLAAGYTLAAP
jgi:elongation factor P hydroxylase